jgi:hypothetical protein
VTNSVTSVAAPGADTRYCSVRIRRIAFLVIAAVVLLAGCRVDTRVDVTLHHDGSGVVASTVTLDASAVQRIGGITEAAKQVRITDLRAAGWAVSPWVANPGGGATITFSHAFTGQADLAARFADLVGPHGVLQSPVIARSRGWFASKDALSMVVDLRAPATGIRSDTDLQARLRAAGLDPSQLDRDLTSELRSALHVQAVLHLPNGGTRTYDVPAGRSTTVGASESTTDWDRVIELGIAAVLVVLAALFALAASASARRARRRSAQRAETRRVERERAPLM